MPENVVQARLSATKQLTIYTLPVNEQTVLEQDETGDAKVFNRPFLAPDGGLTFDANGQLRVTGEGGGGTPAPTEGGAQRW